MVHRTRFVIVFTAAVLAAACGSSSDSPQAGNVLEAVSQQLSARGGWSGTITVKQEAGLREVQDDAVIHRSETESSFVQEATFTLTNGALLTKVSYEVHSTTASVDRYDDHTVKGLLKEDTTAAGTSSRDSHVNVEVYPDGRYEIEFTAGGVTGSYKKYQRTEIVCTGASPECRNDTSEATDSAQPTNLGYVGGGVQDTTRDPNALSGSKSEPYEHWPGQPGKQTISWSLRRQR